MQIQSQFNQSNLSIEDWIRLNNIEDERILELADIAYKYEDLCRSIEDYSPITGDVIDDLIGALKIRDIEDKDILQQLENLKSRLEYSYNYYNQIIDFIS